jgi:hypothetical protein
MDNSGHHLYSNTISQSGLPKRVLSLCDGLFKINSDFFDLHLQNLLNDFEGILFKNIESSPQSESQSEQFAHLRNLQRTRHDFIPRFLASVEHQLSSIRKSVITPNDQPTSAALKHKELNLVDRDSFDENQIQFEISSRCESQNSFDIFLLGQRFGVLAQQPAFDADHLPLGPRKLCLCLQEAIQCLDLDTSSKIQIYYLFERYVFSNFADLISACNIFLIDKGVLSNLTYVPFRNPELRHKKTPIALLGKTDDVALIQNINDQNQNGNVIDFKAFQDDVKTTPAKSHNANAFEENFTELRHLLAKRKQLLNKLNSFSNTYLNESDQQPTNASQASNAPPELLKSIIKGFQHNAINNPNARASIQHLKHDLLAQLRNQSSHDRELTLNDEDSDAIDLVGLLMDNALKDVNPSSVASQLISLMQSPLIHVVLQDKSFFSNTVHPARQMLNIIAETGFNWLDENNTDDSMQEKISSIVNKAVKDYDGNNQEFINAYEETNGLLQALIKKAEAAERRQVEAVRGKERLILARNRAAGVMSELTEQNDMPTGTRALLNKAWTDVMALTELRKGSDSESWLEQKSIAERIIAINNVNAETLDDTDAAELKNEVQSSLSLVGYHQEEAKKIAESLIANKTFDGPNTLVQIPDKIRFGEHTQSANIHVYELNNIQLELAEQIKTIAVGTWFEFIFADSPKPVRRKLAWKSLFTNNILFVNQRGQKTAEMTIEELAIELSEGRARVQIEDKRNIIERAFENVISSLRNLLPSRSSKEP